MRSANRSVASQARSKAGAPETPTNSVEVEEQPVHLPLPNLKTLYRKFKSTVDQPQTRIQTGETTR
jgi:hypothetical protein